MSAATLTELLREPKRVLARTEDGPVRITRRDGDDLVLISASELERQADGVTLASQLIRASRDHGSMRHAILALYPWAEMLPGADLDAFAAEMERLAFAAMDLGRYAALANAFASWRGTAEALADGLPPGPGDHLTWLANPAQVPAP
jgi:prevent-host-death family protein